MINNDRMVPIQKIDYLSMIGTILTLQDADFSILEAADIEGDFSVSAEGTYLANQPVKSLAFEDGVTSATVYFVAAYDYDGTLEDVTADGVTLYKAVLADGATTVTTITPSLAVED